MGDGYYETYIPSKFFLENSFINKEYKPGKLPQYDEIKELLPEPIWEGKENVKEMYDKTWMLAFSNLRHPFTDSGFVSDFIDTAFNGCLFMWDSTFIMMFTKYACKAYDFQQTLDNFYAKQHKDGFICREIIEKSGNDQFHRFDPASTGPNILPWTEWVYYKNFGDKERLKKIFPCLVAYHLWLKRYRTWQDGTYWSSGLGCGMDNQPRLLSKVPEDESFFHEHMSWVDTTIQQVFSAEIILKIAREIGRQDEINELKLEAESLKKIINDKMWDEKTSFYYDLRRNGQMSDVKSVGAFWALISEIVSPERIDSFVNHLSNEKEFKRPHSVPSLSADSEYYDCNGGYWRGSVWAPTNYMVLNGLDKYGYFNLAHEIALNHFNNVLEVFKETGTVWENYSSEKIKNGSTSKSDFVGWTGLVPITVLFEYVFGIKADVPQNKIIWDVNLLEKHGIEKYPFGKNGLISLVSEARTSKQQEPEIKVNSNISFQLVVRWDGKEKRIDITPTRENIN